MVNAGHDEVQWSDDGSRITVRNPERLARDILPRYFRHSQYASWVRALNAYNFKKVGIGQWHHPSFQRHSPWLLAQISRKLQKNVVPRRKSSHCSPAPLTSTAETPTIHLSMKLMIEQEKQKLCAMEAQAKALEDAARSIEESDIELKFDTVSAARVTQLMLSQLSSVAQKEDDPSRQASGAQLVLNSLLQSSMPLLATKTVIGMEIVDEPETDASAVEAKMKATILPASHPADATMMVVDNLTISQGLQAGLKAGIEGLAAAQGLQAGLQVGMVEGLKTAQVLHRGLQAGIENLAAQGLCVGSTEKLQAGLQASVEGLAAAHGLQAGLQAGVCRMEAVRSQVSATSQTSLEGLQGAGPLSDVPSTTNSAMYAVEGLAAAHGLQVGLQAGMQMEINRSKPTDEPAVHTTITSISRSDPPHIHITDEKIISPSPPAGSSNACNLSMFSIQPNCAAEVNVNTKCDDLGENVSGCTGATVHSTLSGKVSIENGSGTVLATVTGATVNNDGFYVGGSQLNATINSNASVAGAINVSIEKGSQSMQSQSTVVNATVNVNVPNCNAVMQSMEDSLFGTYDEKPKLSIDELINKHANSDMKREELKEAVNFYFDQLSKSASKAAATGMWL